MLACAARASAGCPAHCAGGPKNLLVLGPQSHAGLSDRETVIGSMGLLALQLCARLVAPLPCHALNGRHGASVSCRLDWADLFELKDANNSDVIVRSVDTKRVEALGYAGRLASWGRDGAAEARGRRENTADA